MTAAPFPAIIFGGYFVVGCIVAVAVMVSDFAKKKTSIAGLLGDLATFHAVAFVIFMLLGPLWLPLMLFGDDEPPKA